MTPEDDAARDGASDADAGAPDPAPFPWPAPAGISGFDALVRTAAAVLTRPSAFYRSLPIDAPAAPAALFLVILTYAGAGVYLFWEMVLPDPAWVPAAMRTTEPEAIVNFLLSGPIALAITTVLALLVHVGLVIFGARRERPRNTVAVLYYASATSILQIIPWIGVLIAGLASLVITILGVREVHGASTARASAAVLLPLFAVAAMLVLGIFLIVIAGLTTGVISR